MALIVVFVRRQAAAGVPVANYDVSVRINDREIAREEVLMHRREEGWPVLLARFLQQQHPDALATVAGAIARRPRRPPRVSTNPLDEMMMTPGGQRVKMPAGCTIREDGRVERICAHGTGHPIGHVKQWQDWMGVHGCCGCCSKADWYREGAS